MLGHKATINLQVNTDTKGIFVLTNNSDKDYTKEISGNIFSVTIQKGVNNLFTLSSSAFTATGGTCVTNDTLVAMADGSYKKAGELEFGDEVLVFDHYKGIVSSGIIAFNDRDKVDDYKIIHLLFSNGKEIKIATEHGFFDVELNKYIYITENNYQNYIGHKFLSVSKSGINVVTLLNVFERVEHVGVCSPGTARHFNIVTEDILSIAGGVSKACSIFSN